VSTAAENLGLMSIRSTHTTAACIRLLQRFMVDGNRLRLLVGGLVEPGACAADFQRAMVERLSSSLWGLFSHHRAVVDGDGVVYDLGSWRSAAERIADLANESYPDLNLPIRYMDCYVGVLAGEEMEEQVRRLYAWMFTELRAAGCDWLYSRAVAERLHERRALMRELSTVMSAAYENGSGEGLYSPLPSMVAAYQDVYGRLPDGWPHA
jgi:hypothetical protein